MCTGIEWLAIAGLAMSAATAAVSYMQQSTAADNQQKSNDQQAEMNKRQQDSANQAYLNDISQIQLRSRQEQDADSHKLEQAQTEALQARAKERVTAGESGVSGISLEAIMNDYARQEATYKDSIAENGRATQDQLAFEMKGAQATGNSRINSVTPIKPVTRPSYMDAGLRMVGGGLDTFGKLAKRDADGNLTL